MRILSIGNSFSEDAHRWLHPLASAAGIALETHNLYIGGCSLERHRDNLNSGEAAYSYQTNGNLAYDTPISLMAALEDGPWDAITIQQVSQLAGQPDSFEPYLTEILAAVRKSNPKARLYFQETWAYDIHSEHPGFALYNFDAQIMHEAVKKTCHAAAEKHGLTLIPTGEAVALAKQLPEFSGDAAEQKLYRDRFHLHLLYGRYLAACIWLKALTGAPLPDAFIPCEDGISADPALLKALRHTAEQLLP